MAIVVRSLTISLIILLIFIISISYVWSFRTNEWRTDCPTTAEQWGKFIAWCNQGKQPICHKCQNAQQRSSFRHSSSHIPVGPVGSQAVHHHRQNQEETWSEVDQPPAVGGEETPPLLPEPAPLPPMEPPMEPPVMPPVMPPELPPELPPGPIPPGPIPPGPIPPGPLPPVIQEEPLPPPVETTPDPTAPCYPPGEPPGLWFFDSPKVPCPVDVKPELTPPSVPSAPGLWFLRQKPSKATMTALTSLRSGNERCITSVVSSGFELFRTVMATILSYIQGFLAPAAPVMPIVPVAPKPPKIPVVPVVTWPPVAPAAPVATWPPPVAPAAPVATWPPVAPDWPSAPPVAPAWPQARTGASQSSARYHETQSVTPVGTKGSSFEFGSLISMLPTVTNMLLPLFQTSQTDISSSGVARSKSAGDSFDFGSLVTLLPTVTSMLLPLFQTTKSEVSSSGVTSSTSAGSSFDFGPFISMLPTVTNMLLPYFQTTKSEVSKSGVTSSKSAGDSFDFGSLVSLLPTVSSMILPYFQTTKSEVSSSDVTSSAPTESWLEFFVNTLTGGLDLGSDTDIIKLLWDILQPASAPAPDASVSMRTSSSSRSSSGVSKPVGTTPILVNAQDNWFLYNLPLIQEMLCSNPETLSQELQWVIRIISNIICPSFRSFKQVRAKSALPVAAVPAKSRTSSHSASVSVKSGSANDCSCSACKSCPYS